MKRPIRKTILLVFLAEMLIVLVTCGIFSFYHTREKELEDVETRCRSAGMVTESVLHGYGVDTLQNLEDPVVFFNVRRFMKTIRESFTVDSLYLFTETDGVRNYIIRTNSDDGILGAGNAAPSDIPEMELDSIYEEEEPAIQIYKDENGKEMVSWVQQYWDVNLDLMVLIGADISVELRNSELISQFLLIFLPVLFALLAAHGVIYSVIRKRIIIPVQKISGKMESYDPSAVQEPLNIHSQDEIQQIADSYEKMDQDIKKYIENIESLTEEKEREKAQLDVARRIQSGIVPNSFNTEKDGYTLSAMMDPAKEVGGDFYDCFERQDGAYCIVIGDVSGKGIAGALFMSMVRSMIRDRLKRMMDPAAVLNQVNEELCAENPEGMFVTVFAVILNPATGEICCANAGHNPPLRIGRDGARFTEPDPGISLGLFEDSDIINETDVLQEGEGILLYTDGVTDAVSTAREFFGKERIIEAVKEASSPDSKTVLDTLRTDIEKFSEGSEQFDDITAVLLMRQETGREILLEPTMESFEKVKARIQAEYKDSVKAKKAILACEEAFANIVNYSGASRIGFRCEKDEVTLTVTLRDDGKCFDPLAENAVPQKEFEDLDSGGMGIGFIRELTEDMNWKYEEQNNVLTLKFHLE